MVAFNSSRRQHVSPFVTPAAPADMLVAYDTKRASRLSDSAGALRRSGGSVDVQRDRDGDIVQVRIGRWRTLTAGPQRRIVEVRPLSCQRVAVRIERIIDQGQQAASEIWQLYDLEGRIEASLQSTPDGRFALLTNYQTHQACRMIKNRSGDLEAVESWAI